MPDNDGVDDALRSAAQTAAALLARNAQQHAMNREQQAHHRQQELHVENARLLAEDALDGIRSPDLPQGPVMEPSEPAAADPQGSAIAWPDDPVLRSDAFDALRRSREARSQADADYGQRDQADQRARASQQGTEAHRAGADAVLTDVRRGLLSEDAVDSLEDLEMLAASLESEADWLERDADHDWDSASQRETRGRAYDACGNQRAAEARRLADTAQATPPWRAVGSRATARKAPSRLINPAARRRDIPARTR